MTTPHLLVTAAIADSRNGNLYFLTLIVVLVIVLGLAITQTVKKRRARGDDEGGPRQP